MHKFSPFRPFSSISNLRRRVELQEQALRQARADLRAAEDEDVDEEDDEDDEAEKRKKRKAKIADHTDEEDDEKPSASALAKQIISADLRRRGLEPAERDLRIAERREGVEAPSAYISDAHRLTRAADERRRRGLGPTEQTNAGEASAAIIRADRRRRGLEATEPPVSARLPTERATAEQIVAAYRKAKGIKP